ncbi:MAG: hypothetical protein ACE5G2_09035 [Candidatus Krumholzibacteriia bacterium]
MSLRNRFHPRVPVAVLGFLLLGPVLSGRAEAKKVQLTFTPPPKEVLRYKVEFQQETHAGGMEFTFNMTGEAELSFLEKTEDGNSKLAIKLSSIEASMMQMGNLVEQDPGLEGTSVHVTASPRGDVLEVEPQQVLSDAQVELLETLVENFFAYLPEEAVETEDTWVQKRFEESDSDDTDLPALDGSLEYMLDDIEKKDGVQVAKIVGEGSLKINEMTPQGLFAGEAKVESESLTSIASGCVLRKKSSMEVSGKVGGTFDVDQAHFFEVKLQK